MQTTLSITKPASGKHNKSCPFCSGKQPKTLGYNTKVGKSKDEDVLGQNLAAKSQITSDKLVGAVYPLPGGNDEHYGWEVEAGVLLDKAPVDVPCTPHHLIPGDVMSKSDLEKQGWTKAGKKIIEDIGYNIDCAQNGIWLPHLPEIHWTREVTVSGVKKRLGDIYKLFGSLPGTQKLAIGHIIMGDTNLQMHYTGHGSIKKNSKSYNSEALDKCDTIADLMLTFWSVKCKKAKKGSKLYPPYGLVHLINNASRLLKIDITGTPRSWKLWVSTLAKQYTAALKCNKKISAPTVLKKKH